MGVVDGSSMLFWWDMWVEGGTLKARFSCLIYVADNKMTTVAEMNFLVWWENVMPC